MLRMHAHWGTHIKHANVCKSVAAQTKTQTNALHAISATCTQLWNISKPTDEINQLVCATTHPFPTKSRTLGELHVMWPNAALGFMVPIDKTTIVWALVATDLIMTWCDFLRACLSERVWQGRANMLQATGNPLTNLAQYAFQQFLSWSFNPWMCCSNVPPPLRLPARRYRLPRSTTVKWNSKKDIPKS